MLRRIRLYDTHGIGLEHKAALTLGELTELQITREPDGIVVDLGGIYPYNAVEFAGRGNVEIHAFNGTRYEPVWEGTSPARFDTVTGSYKLRLVGDVDEKTVHVFLR